MSFARLANNLFLSYLLAPELFGILAIANIILQGVQMCSDVGVGHCLIQSPRGDAPDFYNTAWTIQILRGLFVWGLMIVASGPLATFYNEPQLQPIIIVLGSTAFIFATASTAQHSARRHLRLAWLTSLEVSSQVIGIVGMCILAFIYRSAWAIVAGAVISAVVFSAMSHMLSPGTKNRMAWDRDSAGELVRFGKWIMIGTFVGFFAMQIDRLLLGKLGNFTQLGLYHFSLALTMMASLVVEKLANSVQFPVLAAIGNSNPEELPQRSLDSRRSLLVVGLVLVVLLFACSPLLFSQLYHDNFADAGWISQLMCLSIWFFILTKTIDRCLLALGDSRSLAYLAFCKLVFCTVFSFLGYSFADLPGFCIGVGAGALVSHGCLYIALRYHGVKIAWQDLRFTLVALGAAAMILLLQHLSIDANLSLSMSKDIPITNHIAAMVFAIFVSGTVGGRQWRLVQRRNASLFDAELSISKPVVEY